jgi:hypothetical protein
VIIYYRGGKSTMPTIDDLSDIDLAVPHTAAVIDSSIKLVKNLQTVMSGLAATSLDTGASRLALIAAISVSTAMLAMARATCTLGPTPADIDVTVDSEGNLILRCGHALAHEWNYQTGTRR